MVVAGEIETKKRGKREMGEDVVVVMVGVAVVGLGLWRHGSKGQRRERFESRKRELRDCESSEKKRKKNIC